MEKKHVLVIGESSAIGAAIATEARARGHRVLGTARAGGEGIVQMDVRDDDGVRDGLEQALHILGRIDAVIYAPAITDRSLVHAADMAAWQSVYEVNVLGAVRTAKSLLPHFMKQRDGVFLFISSIAAVRGVIGSSAYSASKAALNALAKNISREYGRFNVRAYSVMPGHVNGGMLKDMEARRVEEASKGISLRRFAEVDEIARFVVSTLDVGYLTGTSISMDGGSEGS